MPLVRFAPLRLAAAVGLTVAVTGAGCAGTMAEADQRFSDGEWRDAIARYDRLAARAKTAPPDRVHALTQAGLACQRIRSPDGARARWEQAADPEVPGASEPALYYLAGM